MENILIVDDEEEIVQLMSETIHKWGYNTVVAQDGEEALQKFEEFPIDLVLSDLRLPNMDGVSLLEHIKNVDNDTEVILFTGYPAVKSAVEAMKKGAFDYLIKPVDLHELQLKLERGLENRKTVRSNSALKGLNWAMIISIPIWLILGIYIANILK